MSSDPLPPGPTLVFQLAWWEVELHDGTVLDIRADFGTESDGALILSVLVAGQPDVLLEVVRIPLEAVARWEGGWREQRTC